MSTTFTPACSLEELKAKTCLVKTVNGRALALFYHQDAVYAIDNRCPHMGFPLSRGAVRDGVLTCPWHHARFELCSGGTFDLFADDARSYPVELRDGEVWVNPRAERDEKAYQQKRLTDGLEQNISLVLAKSCISLIEHGADPADILRVTGVFGSTQRHAGWRDGLTILTAMGNLLPHLAGRDRPLALYHGALHVADNVAGQRPHFAVGSIPVQDVTLDRLRNWLRQFAEVRDRDGVERVLVSAVQAGLSPAQLADMLVAAATDHYYLDGGHTIDFVNKACELLDHIGWAHAQEILPSIVPGITQGTRMEERSSWRRPVDLVAVLGPIFTELSGGTLIDDVHRSGTLDDDAFDTLVETLLGDDPHAIARQLAEALKKGAGLTQLSLALCYAAALRIARYHTSNEFSDWISVLHTFTAASASHRLLQRAPSLEAARGLWHVAMDLYLNRFFNQPAAKLPSGASTAPLSEDADTLLRDLLALTDQRQRVEEAAALSWRYLSLGHPAERLIETLAHTLLREDGEFHSYQMLEAAVTLYHELLTLRPALAPHVLVALARYLAGHAPTDRATTQTYDIAARLHRGEVLVEGA